jgi:protein phosphatase
MSEKVVHIQPVSDYRVVVISDIHGHLDHFKDLLEQVALKAEDYLIILGDYINRGPKSYETLQYVMGLNKRPNTVVLKGNHESFMERPLRENDHVGEIVEFLKTDPYDTLWHSFGDLSGRPLHRCDDPESFRQHLLKTFDNELTYLEKRPILLYFDEFLFVHGGYDENFSLEEDETKFLKYDFFDRESCVQEKKVVVGHFPACILRDDVLSNQPYFNRQKNIITIDGGLGVKGSGELNALIIEKVDGQITYSNRQVNDFEEVEIIKTHSFDEEVPVYVHWPNKEFELLEHGDEMSLCRHEETKRTFTIFNELIEYDEDKYRLKYEFANTFFNLPVGARVKKCKVFNKCVLIKHDDLFGWIRRDQID